MELTKEEMQLALKALTDLRAKRNGVTEALTILLEEGVRLRYMEDRWEKRFGPDALGTAEHERLCRWLNQQQQSELDLGSLTRRDAYEALELDRDGLNRIWERFYTALSPKDLDDLLVL